MQANLWILPVCHWMQRNSAGLSDIMAHVKADASDALAQALQEKVFFFFLFFLFFLILNLFFIFILFNHVLLWIWLIYLISLFAACLWFVGIVHCLHSVMELCFFRLQHYCFYHSRRKDIYWTEMWMQLSRKK